MKVLTGVHDMKHVTVGEVEALRKLGAETEVRDNNLYVYQERSSIWKSQFFKKDECAESF